MTETTHITKSPNTKPHSGHVEGVGDEIHYVPEIAGVLLETDVPELLDLAPDEARDPGEDAGLHQGGLGAPLGDTGVLPLVTVPAQHVLNPLRGQDQ